MSDRYAPGSSSLSFLNPENVYHAGDVVYADDALTPPTAITDSVTVPATLSDATMPTDMLSDVDTTADDTAAAIVDTDVITDTVDTAIDTVSDAAATTAESFRKYFAQPFSHNLRESFCDESFHRFTSSLFVVAVIVVLIIFTLYVLNYIKVTFDISCTDKFKSLNSFSSSKQLPSSNTTNITFPITPINTKSDIFGNNDSDISQSFGDNNAFSNNNSFASPVQHDDNVTNDTFNDIIFDAEAPGDAGNPVANI